MREEKIMNNRAYITLPRWWQYLGNRRKIFFSKAKLHHNILTQMVSAITGHIRVDIGDVNLYNREMEGECQDTYNVFRGHRREPQWGEQSVVSSIHEEDAAVEAREQIFLRGTVRRSLVEG